MLDFLKFITDQSVVAFLFLFIRFSSTLAFVIFYDSQTIPTAVKGALAFWLTLVFYPLVSDIKIPLDTNFIILGILSEAMFGFITGFFLTIITTAFSFAGESMSQAMGLNMASVLDPMSNTNVQVVSFLLLNLMLVVFLEINGHHWVLEYIAYSLEKVPLGGFILSERYFEYTLYSAGHLFAASLMLAFPIMAISLLTNIVYGLLMRTMPNFNILVIGQPATLLLGMILLIVTISSMAIVFKREISDAFNHIMVLL